MSNLSTKNVKAPGHGVSKTINPGNLKLKINSMELATVPWSDTAFHIVMNVETPPVDGDFTGFKINPDDSNSPTYAGQVGRVKMSFWPYDDKTFDNGNTIDRNVEMVKAIKGLCEAIGEAGQKWDEESDNKYPTIETFVQAFNDSAVYKDVYLDVCVAGKEYEGKGGYVNYDMYLPKFQSNARPYVGPGTMEGNNVIDFKADDHLIPLSKTNIKQEDPASAAPAPIPTDLDV